MTSAEIKSLQLPCLVIHKETGLVVDMETVHGNDGSGIVLEEGSGAHYKGKYLNSWNMSAFSMMDNNDQYGRQE